MSSSLCLTLIFWLVNGQDSRNHGSECDYIRALQETANLFVDTGQPSCVHPAVSLLPNLRRMNNWRVSHATSFFLQRAWLSEILYIHIYFLILLSNYSWPSVSGCGGSGCKQLVPPHFCTHGLIAWGASRYWLSWSSVSISLIVVDIVVIQSILVMCYSELPKPSNLLVWFSTHVLIVMPVYMYGVHSSPVKNV